MSRYFKYLLLAIFFGAVFLIVFLQYNSNSSINQLISGNEDILNELRLKNNLQQLKTGIAALESKVRGAVIDGNRPNEGHIIEEIKFINTTAASLNYVDADSSFSLLKAQLSSLIHKEISFNNGVLDTFSLYGKYSAEKIINSQRIKPISDSIATVCNAIDKLHEAKVTAIVKAADSDGNKAKTLGTIIASIAALASLITFLYVSYNIRQQQLMIQQLNHSEKKARDAAKVKEHFLANMSHEIRTPLNAILGFSNLLSQKKLDEESKTFVSNIKTSGDSLLAIVNDILDLSKIEAGMMRIETVSFSIESVLAATGSMFRQKMEDKKLHFVTKISEEIPGMLYGDPTRLMQVLVNLIGNALKFTDNGFVNVSISKLKESADLIYVNIIVEDSGVGISPDDQKLIFSRFFQTEESAAKQYGGTGLGLSIVKDLVELQNGIINVESIPNKGTIFIITIPYKKIETVAGKIKPLQQIEQKKDIFRNIRVLVVEDNEMNQSLVAHLLQQQQIGFDIAPNGQNAIEKIKEVNYDLILMDIQMPVMDGYATTKIIRSQLKNNVPIVAITAHAFELEKEKCLGCGMNDYLSKPLRPEEMNRVIEKYVSKEMPTEQYMETDTIGNQFKYIRLQYLKELSFGNNDFEKKVTQQFTEELPLQLQQLKYSIDNSEPQYKEIAHNIKTTISIMGLNDLLNPYLDTIEYSKLTNTELTKAFEEIHRIAEKSIYEAKCLLDQYKD